MPRTVVQKAYKFALDPTPRQARQFASHCGGVRYAYNWGLNRISDALDAYQAEKAAGVAKPAVKVPGHFDLCKMWTAFKDDPESGVPWVGDNFVGSYQAALRDAAGAWKKFFDSRAGRRAGRAAGRPRFKSRRRSRWAFQVHGETVRIASGAAIRPAIHGITRKLTKAARAKLTGEALRDARARAAAAKFGPARSDAGTLYLNLPRIGLVKIPGLVRVGTLTDRNARTARKLHRLLDRAETATCPGCSGTGAVTTTTEDGGTRDTKCASCRTAGTMRSARIVRATISRGASGTWWCSVTAEVIADLPDGPSRRQRVNGTVGLDLGTRYLAVDSDGTIHANPQHLDQALADLRVAQQTLSRTQPDSRRREKARRRVGTIHEQVALMRKSSIDRITTLLARTFNEIVVEGWDAQRLAERGNTGDAPARIKRRRNRQLADAAPGMFRWQLEYKTSWTGSKLAKADRHQETGRTCSVCGTVKDKPVPLHHDEFVCPATTCGTRIDRRVNTARVLRAAGGGRSGHGTRPPGPEPTKPRGEDVRPETVRRGRQSSLKRAARTRPPPD